MNRITKALAIFGIAAAAGFLTGTAWNGGGSSSAVGAGFEASPAGTDLAADLDTYITQLKAEIRQRMEVEHNFGGSTDDNGLHAMGSARCFVQNSSPTDINSGTAALGQYNSSAGSDAGTTLSTDEIGAAVRDIGAGRCWIDLDGPDGTLGTPDDRSLAIWDETNNNFKYIGSIDGTVVSTLNQRFLDAGKYNLLYNGSFEIYDGVGGNNGSTVVPAGWALNNATVTYTNNPTNTEGNGAQVDVTATAGGGSLRQTLTTLKASTTYYVVGRVKATAGDTCDIITTGAATNLDSTDVASSAAFATTGGTFITDATVTAVVLNLRSVNNTDICHWDSVAVYETSSDKRNISSPGQMAVYDSDTTSSAVSNVRTVVPNLTASFIPPGPGWVVEVHADISLHDSAGSPNSSVMCGLDNGSDMAGTNTAIGMSLGGDASWSSLHLSAVQVNPTPGTMLTYTVECLTTDPATVVFNGGAGAGPGATTLASNLWIIARPSR